MGASASGLDSERFRSVVERGIAKGLIRKPGTAIKVDRPGVELADLAGAKVQVVDVTPEMAERWMRNNFRNRPISLDVVRTYAADMKAGRWPLTHQGIAFNDADELIDGQHRLQAIIMSGCTIRMQVTFGLRKQVEKSKLTVMDCVDRGRTRSVADQLKIQHGMKDGTAIAAISVSLANLCEQRRTRRLSVGQVLAIHEEFREAIAFVIAHRPKKHGIRSTAVMAGFAFAITAGIEPAQIRNMYEALVSQGGPKPKSAMHLLREFLLSPEAILLNRGTDRAVVELVLDAVRMALAGERPTKLTIRPDGAEFFKSPQRERVERVCALFNNGETRT